MEKSLKKTVENKHKEIYAKTINVDGATKPSFSVFSHCVVTGIVAKKLAEVIQKRETPLPKGCDLKDFAIFCARHDVGKASPGFQYMLDINLNEKSKYRSLREIEQEYCRQHEQVSAEFLKANDEVIARQAEFILAIIRWHHGRNRGTNGHSYDSASLDITDEDIIPKSYGNDDGEIKWNTIRKEIDGGLVDLFGNGHDFIKKLIEAMKAKECPIQGYEDGAILNPIVKYLSGFLSVCDWISSDENAFHPNIFNKDVLDIESIEKHAEEIIEKIGLDFSRPIQNLSFGDIFKDNEGIPFEPNWIQKELAKAIDSSGVYVVEANMGEGKTEAALYAAYSAMSKGLIDGIYFGLPTQVTSNTLFERFDDFVLSSNEKLDKNNIRLNHGKASFSEEMMSRYSWFSGNKKGILSQFGIGTIDQAIISVMGDIKHFYIRTFGLTKKCLIIDEVHSYDVYTASLITELIDQQLKLGGIVIILSATLTANSRSSLAKIDETEYIKSYPLITKKTDDGVCYISKNKKNNGKKIKIRRTVVGIGDSFLKGREGLIEEVIKRAKNGEMILWIENTVSEAQAIYKRFSHCGVDVGLLHSSFTNEDRINNEKKWIGKFGKNGDRTKGAILISTQVCEQSVDIDSDFLITALAPTDMLFQRMGRLHRHSSNKRKTEPECVILDIENYGTMDETINWFNYKKLCGVSTYVYDPIVLRNTHNVWKNIEYVTVPNDMREMIEKTYSMFFDENDKVSNKLYETFRRETDIKKNKAIEASYKNHGSSNDNIDRFSDDVNSDDSTTSITNTRWIENIKESVILCKEFNEKTITTIYGKMIDLDKIKLPDMIEADRASLKVKTNLITKYGNVFNKIEIGKRVYIVCKMKNGISIDFTNGSYCKKITYDENGFRHIKP